MKIFNGGNIPIFKKASGQNIYFVLTEDEKNKLDNYNSLVLDLYELQTKVESLLSLFTEDFTNKVSDLGNADLINRVKALEDSMKNKNTSDESLEARVALLEDIVGSGYVPESSETTE